jgi:hypothetical protein
MSGGVDRNRCGGFEIFKIAIEPRNHECNDNSVCKVDNNLLFVIELDF